MPTFSMFSPDEQQAIRLKAIEQALRAAGIAHAEPEPLLPMERTPRTWIATWKRPHEIVGEHCFSYACGLTDADRTFLKVNKISPA